MTQASSAPTASEKCGQCGLIGAATANCGAGLLCPVPQTGPVPITQKDAIVGCTVCGFERAVPASSIVRGRGSDAITCWRDQGSCEATVMGGVEYLAKDAKPQRIEDVQREGVGEAAPATVAPKASNRGKQA